MAADGIRGWRVGRARIRLGAVVALATCLAACGHDWSGPGDASDGEAEADGDSPSPDAVDGDADAGGGCVAPRIVCGGTCIDPTSDLGHCGECWWLCEPPNGTGSCAGGECSATCNPGWIDANGTAVDGCEYACTPAAGSEAADSTCGNGLDDDCDARTDGSDPDCARCVPEFCNLADDDCDGLTDEDFDLDFAPLDCGACGNACPRRPHASAACVLGECDITCAPAWTDADGNPHNGCEAACVPTPSAAETVCDGVDDDCDGLVDEDWSSTTSCGFSSCARVELCLRGEISCHPRTPPSTTDTTCDGLDDDCDGATDEEASCGCASDADCDDSNPCTNDDCGADLLCHISPAADGTSCPTGRCCSRACVGDTSELCNGRDDDCDGGIDEGFDCRAGETVSCTTSCGATGSGRCTGSCAAPTGSDCYPPPEACNGADDDCDGSCDDGFGCCRGEVRDCTTGGGADGVQSCGPDCNWGSCAATSDPCNGVDDNGDTRCDEAFECCRGASDSRACTCGGTETRSCDSACSWTLWGGCAAGECAPEANEACSTPCGSTGLRFCEASCTWGACAPPGESCNGVDDDCDGAADEGWSCAAGASGSCSMPCGTRGSRTCDAWCAWGACAAPAETCNGVDDDCDGSTDEDFWCPAGAEQACTNGCGAPGLRTCDSSCSWGPCLPAGTSVTCYVCAEDPDYLPSGTPYCGDLYMPTCTLRSSNRLTDYSCFDTYDSWELNYCCP